MPPRQTRQLKAPQCTQIGRDHLKKECNLGHLLSQKLEDIDLEKMEANQDFALLEIPVYWALLSAQRNSNKEVLLVQ